MTQYEYMKKFEPLPDSVEKVAKDTVDGAFRVHTKFGPGLAESLYEECLTLELEAMGHNVKNQVVIPIEHLNKTINTRFRMDMIVDDCLIVEVKAIKELHPYHKSQLLTYLTATGIRLGLLMNFGETQLKNGICRMIK